MVRFRCRNEVFGLFQFITNKLLISKFKSYAFKSSFTNKVCKTNVVETLVFLSTQDSQKKA